MILVRPHHRLGYLPSSSLIEGSRLSVGLPLSKLGCYNRAMLKTRIKRRADQGARALKLVATFQAEIAALPDEDLLDLADIFASVAGSTISEIANVEMNKRGISL
jgi:hypothetical protein